jgi:Protein of unknown function (DUF4013)
MHSQPTTPEAAAPTAVPESVPLPTSRRIQFTYRHVEAVIRVACRLAVVSLGWAWRVAVGAVFCTNLFLSILVVGWLYRWMQWRALNVWWRQSRAAKEGSFEDFCDSLGLDSPTPRPRWFLRDHFRWHRIQQEMKAPTWDGEPPGFLRLAARAVVVPVRALWLNFWVGLKALFCTYSLTCWGCLLMTWAWEYGGLNSFNKGYEQAWVGQTFSLLGVLLFVAALFYVPMAQVHQAVTGDMRAFFDFRFLWQLIRARLTAYVIYAGLFIGIALVFEMLKTAPLFMPWCDLSGDPTPAELRTCLACLAAYYLVCGFLLFLTLLLTRRVAVSIYCSAVLKVLRRGRVRHEELHPKLGRWLDRMGVLPAVIPQREGAVLALRKTGRLFYRWALWTVLFFLWMGFAAPKQYVGESLNYHPVLGFMNHPMIQFPAFDYIPYSNFIGASPEP